MRGGSGLSGSFAIPAGGGMAGGMMLNTLTSTMYDSMADLHMENGGNPQIPVWDDETNMLVLKVWIVWQGET